MKWTVSFTKSARKNLAGLSSKGRDRVLKFLTKRVVDHPDPRVLAKRLKGLEEELWRFRVGDLRIIARISEGEMTILVIEVGHRREFYR